MIGSAPPEFYKPSAAKRKQQREDAISLLIGMLVMGLWLASLWFNSKH